MTPDLILNELDELGARIDAIASLGAGIAAALAAETIAPDDVYHMLATYAGGLLALQKAVRSRVAVATTFVPGNDDGPTGDSAPAKGTAAQEPAPLDRGRPGDGTRRTHMAHAPHEHSAALTPG